jgi:hypothetical protein
MKIMRLVRVTLLTTLFCGIASAQDHPREDRVPRWMTPEAGFIDPESGSKVEEVSATPDKNIYRVTISIPKVDTPIEEVVVIGRKEDKPEFKLPVEYEIINDLDKDRSGIILYMGTDREFALRINYHDGSHSVFPQNQPVGGLSP